jgi:hypothetical protein
MTVGMVPMALALEKGSEMQAPLGRAVIGGLVMSTFATLLVVPSIFAVVIGKRTYGSPSIYPDDRDSKHYDPNVFADEEHKDGHGGPEPETDGEPSPHDVVAHHTDDEILGFLRGMLHEIRQKRREMITHHTIDDLKGPLGFVNDDPGEAGQFPKAGTARDGATGPEHDRDADKKPSGEAH